MQPGLLILKLNTNYPTTVMTDIFLVTAGNMPKQEPETGLLQEALKEINVSASIVSWDDPNINWQHSKLSLIRTPWDYFDRLEEFRQWLQLAATKTTVWNPVEIINWNIHKSYLLGMEQAGVPIVPTILTSKGDPRQLSEIVGTDFADEIVIKPAVSINAYGAGRFEAGDVNAELHLKQLLESKDVLIQPFIPEIMEHGEASLIFFKSEFSHAIRKIAKKGDYRVQNNWGGRVIQHTPSAAEMQVAKKALSVPKTELLYARVDLVSTENGPLLMELELIEPDLYLSYVPGAFRRFAEYIKTTL